MILGPLVSGPCRRWTSHLLQSDCQISHRLRHLLRNTLWSLWSVWVALIDAWESPSWRQTMQRYILVNSTGCFYGNVCLFGLLGPVVLAFLTWETAKIRSTQSATGILYVDFFTVVWWEKSSQSTSYLFDQEFQSRSKKSGFRIGTESFGSS